MKKALLICVTLATTACAPMMQSGGMSVPARWDKPGITEEGFQKDKRECIYDAQRYGEKSNNVLIEYAEQNRMFVNCLQSRGYSGI